MTTLNKILPSKESRQIPNQPITMINRKISKHTMVVKHSHSWGQFVYAEKGVLSVVTDDVRYIVPPEQGVWILPDIAHEVTAVTDVKLSSFYINNKSANALPKQCSVILVNSFLKALFREALTFSAKDFMTKGDKLVLSLILERIAIAPKVNFQLPYPKDARLLKIFFMIQENPAKTYRLNEWGNIVGASSRTLSRLFKLETGLTYRAWRQKLNIQLAISYLSSGKAIHNIALELGYESPSAFSHMFKAHTKMSPSFYRDKAD